MNKRPLFSIGEESDASDEGLLKNGDATLVKYEDKNSNLRLNYALAFLLGGRRRMQRDLFDRSLLAFVGLDADVRVVHRAVVFFVSENFSQSKEIL